MQGVQEASRQAVASGLTRAEAARLIWENSWFDRRIETVRLEDACGRVLAWDLCSKYDVPTTLTCRWDGIAVRYDDFADGLPDTSSWRVGREYVYGNTGVAMAPGYDTLIRIEFVEKHPDGSILVTKAPACRGENTIAQASTMRKGEPIGRAHEVLTPRHLGLLGMGGHALVHVVARPRVGIIPSGNELVGRDMALGWGKNYETNSLVLSKQFEEWGAEPLAWDIVPDDAGLLLEALLQAARETDIVVFNAGSSKGTDDHAREVLEAAGRLLFHRTSYGPGNHTGYAVVEGTPVLALVGVPGGADLNACWFGRMLVQKYLYQVPRKPRTVMARVANDYVVQSFRPVQMYAGVVLEDTPTGLEARVLSRDDVFRTGYVDANGIVCIEPEWGGLAAGQMVEVEMRTSWDDLLCAPLEFCRDGARFE